MSNNINGLLSTFKTNMMNNGITVNSSDRFKSLIDKIATMVEEGSGKGIQFATGNCNIETVSGSPDSYYIKSKLNFKPNIILIRNGFNVGFYNDFIDDIFFTTYTSNGTTYRTNYSATYRDGYVNETGFKLNTINNVLFANSIFYAIGVGEEDNTLRDSLASILENKGVSVTEEDDMASLISKVDEEFDNRITMKTGTLNYTNGLVGENNNGKLIITHNLGTIPSYIVCRTSEMDYMPNDSSVGRNFTGSLCLTIDNSAYVTANGNRATLSITNITENTFTVLTTMETSGRLSGWIEEWIVMK